VLRRYEPNIADKQPSLVGVIPPGTILFGRRTATCRRSPVPPSPPAAPVAKQADSMLLSIGEHEGK